MVCCIDTDAQSLPRDSQYQTMNDWYFATVITAFLVKEKAYRTIRMVFNFIRLLTMMTFVEYLFDGQYG